MYWLILIGAILLIIIAAALWKFGYSEKYTMIAPSKLRYVTELTRPYNIAYVEAGHRPVPIENLSDKFTGSVQCAFDLDEHFINSRECRGAGKGQMPRQKSYITDSHVPESCVDLCSKGAFERGLINQTRPLREVNQLLYEDAMNLTCVNDPPSDDAAILRNSVGYTFLERTA